MIVKLQIAGNIYFTKVKEEHLDAYLMQLTDVLLNPDPTRVSTYDAEDEELNIKKLVFKETALEAFVVLNEDN